MGNGGTVTMLTPDKPVVVMAPSNMGMPRPVTIVQSG